MHIVLDLFAMLLVNLLGGSLVLGQLHHSTTSAHRRLLLVLVLAMPLMSFSIEIGGVYHMASRGCLLPDIPWDPPWDPLLDRTILLVMAGILLAAIIFGGVRLVLMRRRLRLVRVASPPEVQMLAHTLARQCAVAAFQVQIVHQDHPLALTYGLRKPVVLLSTWMLEHLDSQELEAVLMHELEHVRQRDYLTNWLAIVLRDVFFYLPTSRVAYRQLAHEREVACDDWAVSATHHPLALASALTKMWLSVVDPHSSSLAQPLIGRNAAVSQRIERLLHRTEPQRPPHAALLSRSVWASIGITMIVMTMNLGLMWVLTVCWHG